jgi:hypothetical protein
MAALQASGFYPFLVLIPYMEPTVRAARAALGRDLSREVRTQGAALSLDTAVAAEFDCLSTISS